MEIKGEAVGGVGITMKLYSISILQYSAQSVLGLVDGYLVGF